MLFRDIDPSIFLTNSSVIERPKPLPFSERPLSHLYSLSKIYGKSSLLIPIPLFVISLFILFLNNQLM